MSNHPSVVACEMCGALVANLDAHDAFHVKLADHDRNVLAAIDATAGAIESMSTLQDIDGERIGALETAVQDFERWAGDDLHGG